ncbi:MAG: pyruvate kinase [Acidobacteria bacterium]|nr:pyruvate kinase [Acidobacteriota bacterium]
MRRAKIIATIGPATERAGQLKALIKAGMDVARLNFSHGSYSSYSQIIKDLRRYSSSLGIPIAIMQDLQGPKIRTGALKRGQPVQLIAGEEFTITTHPLKGDRHRVSTSYNELPHDVKKGDRVLLSDGLIELNVKATDESSVITEVITGGVLRENQGINVPGAVFSAPPLSEKDLTDLEFGLKHQLDYVALSFVRRASDVLALRKELARRHSDLPIIAKLEKPQAIENLDEILKVCEGVMVARGDLGVELSPEKVPVVQKEVIRKANQSDKIVIIATQMLESMIANRRPTRAEASDVANAVFDGTDAVMLSAETATGIFPIESLEMMARIVEEAEKVSVDASCLHNKWDRANLSFPQAVCDAAYHASKAIRANAIIVFTQTGATARLVSKYRPETNIIAFTPYTAVVNRMGLLWGVHPMRMHEISNVDELIHSVEKILLRQGLVGAGDEVVILTGAPIMEKGHTSLMKLHKVRG